MAKRTVVRLVPGDYLAGPNAIHIIKAIRHATGYGLKESKDIYDNAKGPGAVPFTFPATQEEINILLGAGAKLVNTKGEPVKARALKIEIDRPVKPPLNGQRKPIPSNRDALPRTRLVLGEGEQLIVNLEGTDGEFIISFDIKNGQLRVESDLPDDQGRKGVIYCEIFGGSNEDTPAP